MRLILLTILTLTSNLVFAFDIAQVYNLAKQNDPVLKSALETKKQTIEQVPIARSLLLPNLELDGNSRINDSDAASGSFNTHTTSLTLDQTILDFAKVYSLKQANDSAKAAIATYEAARQDLIVRVVKQYFQVLIAKDNVNFNQQNKRAFKKQLSQSNERFKVGLIPITDVNESQAKYDSAVASLIAAENILEDELEILSEIIGVNCSELSDLKKISLLKPEPNNIDDWVKLATDLNPNLLAQRHGVKALKDAVNVERAGHAPTFDLNLQANEVKGARPSSNRIDSKYASLSFRLPIFSSGNILARTRAAAYAYQAGKFDSEQVLRKTISDTKQSYRGVVTKISEVQALEQSVKSSISAYEATKASYDVGSRTIVDVLDAQTNVFAAKRNLSRAKYEYIIESINLKQATGILTDSDVAAINELLL